MAKFEDTALAQINAIEEKYDLYLNTHNLDAYSSSGISDIIVEDKFYAYIISATLTAIDRITGSDSIYMHQANLSLGKDRRAYWRHITSLMGILESLKADVSGGFLEPLKELIHAELFSDFLEMADFLLSEGYKDAAAVMGGGTLESHLRKLCDKNKIDVDISSNGNTRPKKADQLNADLAKKKIYSVLDQKNVTAWLGLRNSAAHAKYNDYTKDHVGNMLQGIRTFIAHYPA